MRKKKDCREICEHLERIVTEIPDPNVDFVEYPMARHSMALDPPLRTAYLMKYNVPDYGILEIFHT